MFEENRDLEPLARRRVATEGEAEGSLKLQALDIFEGAEEDAASEEETKPGKAPVLEALDELACFQGPIKGSSELKEISGVGALVSLEEGVLELPSQLEEGNTEGIDKFTAVLESPEVLDAPSLHRLDSFEKKIRDVHRSVEESDMKVDILVSEDMEEFSLPTAKGGACETDPLDEKRPRAEVNGLKEKLGPEKVAAFVLQELELSVGSKRLSKLVALGKADPAPVAIEVKKPDEKCTENSCVEPASVRKFWPFVVEEKPDVFREPLGSPLTVSVDSIEAFNVHDRGPRRIRKSGALEKVVE